MSDASISADLLPVLFKTRHYRRLMAFLQTHCHQFQQQHFLMMVSSQYQKPWKASSLQALQKQSSLQFTLSSSDIEQVNQLSFSVGGVTYDFDLAFGDVFKNLQAHLYLSHLLTVLGKMRLKSQNIQFR